MALARGKGQNCLQFWRVWESLSIQPFCVLLLPINSSLPFGRVHQTRPISLNLLSQVSVLLRTAHRGQCRSKSVAYLCRYAKRHCRFGTLGARAFSSPQNFDGLLANLNSRMTRSHRQYGEAKPRIRQKPCADLGVSPSPFPEPPKQKDPPPGWGRRTERD